MSEYGAFDDVDAAGDVDDGGDAADGEYADGGGAASRDYAGGGGVSAGGGVVVAGAGDFAACEEGIQEEDGGLLNGAGDAMDDMLAWLSEHSAFT